MVIFTWGDLLAAYQRAVRLIDRCCDVVWIEHLDSDDDEVGGITVGELFREAQWARSWVIVLAQDHAHRTGLRTGDVLSRLRREVYPDGHYPRGAGDPLDF